MSDVDMDSPDENYIWQRRIHHSVRYQKSAVPFTESTSIGLQFNVALERKEKLDMSLLTNAVLLEICEFAKAVTKSETFFLFEMLESNFDLALEEKSQCYEYAKLVHNKIRILREQIKCKPQRWKELFNMPSLSSLKGLTGPEYLRRNYPEWIKLNSGQFSSLNDGSMNHLSLDDQKTTSSPSNEIKRKGVRSAAQAYPYCKELGVSLTIPLDNTQKQKLDPSLVTSGVMMELLRFSRVLCGSHNMLVHDLLKQNFGFDLDTLLFRNFTSKLMERRNGCKTAEAMDAFRKEICPIQPKRPKRSLGKRKRFFTDDQGLDSPPVPSKTLAEDIWRDDDLSYMRPVDLETDVLSVTEDKPENNIFESTLSVEAKSAGSQDVKQDEGEVSISQLQPQKEGPNLSPSNILQRSALLKGVSDLFFEYRNQDVNIKTLKQKLWVQRSALCKQILQSSKVNDGFSRCRRIALDFNVGSGVKQNVEPKLLTNFVLFEVHKFASMMTNSNSKYLHDILDRNFNLNKEVELQRHDFLIYIITKENDLQNHPDREKMEFLNSPVGFPEVYNTVDVTLDPTSGEDTEMMSPASTTSQESLPFCNKLGLNLWSTEPRPANKKLNLNVLTNGALFEIFGFIRELCGTVREIVNDILEHNFDIDLQNKRTEVERVIHKWFAAQGKLIKKPRTPELDRWLNIVVPLNSHSQVGSKRKNGGDVENTEEGEAINRVKPIEDYHNCKEIGLDLVIDPNLATKTKLDLGALTRGVLFEVHQYVEQNCNRYVPALYEILNYNFDLSSQNHCKVEFAWSIASKVMGMVGKKGRTGEYLKKVFELPFEVSESPSIVCKQEPEDGFSEPDLNDDSEVTFVREMKPVDIEVEID